MLPERDQLIRNLFISAESKDYDDNLRRHKLVSPDFIRIILQDTSKQPLPRRKELFQSICHHFQTNPNNSLILSAKQQALSDHSLSMLDDLLMFAMRTVTAKQDVEKYAQLFRSVLTYYEVGLRSLKKMTRELGRDYHQERFNELRFRYIVKMVRTFYLSRPVTTSQPLNFFYFYGPESGIRLASPQPKWPFSQTFSVILCFEYSLARTPGYLVWIESSQQQMITIQIQKESLRCQLLSSQIELGEVKPHIWYYLSFEYDLEKGRVNAYLNQQHISKTGLPTLTPDNDRMLTNCTFGRDLQGKMNSIIVLNGPIAENLYRDMPFGVESWDTIKIIKQNKFFDKVFLSYFPFAMVTEQQFRDTCHDIFKKNNGQLMQNTIAHQNRFGMDSIGKYGGLKLILPMFYLVQFYPDPDSSLLQQVMSLAMTPFQQKFPDTQKQALQCQFFSTMSFHLSKLPPRYINSTLIKQLKEFKSYIKEPRLKQQFFRHALWGLRVNHVSNLETIELLYKLIMESYQNSLAFNEEAYNLERVLYYMVRNLESVSNNCCLQHYVNQSLLTQSPVSKNVKKLDDYKFAAHLRCIQPIVVYLISEGLRSDYRKGLQQVRSLLRLLLHKFSSCFYINLIRILKKLLKIDKPKSTSQTQVILRQCNPLPYLYHLCQKTINPDVIAEVLDVVFFLYNRFRRFLDDKKVLAFVIGLFKKLPGFLHKPKDHLKLQVVRGIRKESVDRAVRIDRGKRSMKCDSKSIDNYRTKMKMQNQQLTFNEVSSLLKIKAQSIANSMDIYQSIKRFYSSAPGSQDQLLIDNQDAFRVLAQFYRITQPHIRQIILVQLLSLAKFSPQNAVFLQNSLVFTWFLFGVIKQQMAEAPISYEMAVKLLVELFESSLASRRMFLNYFAVIKGTIEVIGDDRLFVLMLEQLLKKVKADNEPPYILWRHLVEAAFVEYRIHDGDYVLPFFADLLQFLYDQLTTQFSYVSQQYFQSSTIFAYILQSKYHSPLRDFLLTELSPPKQDDIVLLFDNLINKSITVPKGNKIDVESVTTKGLYMIEVYLQIAKAVCEVLKEQKEKLEKFAKIMLKMGVVFVCILTNEESKKSIKLENCVLGRKIVVETCQYFYSSYEGTEDAALKEIFHKNLIHLFQFLFEYIEYIDRTLGRHSNFDALLHRLSTLTKTNYNPFILELFQYFIRSESNKPLLTLIDVGNMVKYQFAYLKESFIKSDFQFAFNRLSIAEVLEICSHKELEFLRGQYKMVHSCSQRLLDSLKLGECQAMVTEQILQTFDSQNPLQQKARLSFISGQEKNLRRTMEKWKKLWNKLRIYNNLYGIWMNQNDTPLTSHTQSPKINPNKNFISKLPKYYCPQSRSRPILTCSVVEPWHIIKRRYEEKNQHLLNINLIPQRNPDQSPTKYTLRDIFLFKFSKPRSSQRQFRVVILKDSIKIRGFIHLTTDYMLFQYDGVTQSDSHLSFSQFKLEVFNQLFKKWYYIDILNIVRRRYLMKYTCVEVMLATGASILINFESKQLLAKFLDQILNIRKQKLSKFKQLPILNHVAFFTQAFLLDLPPGNLMSTQLVEQWRSHRISTFEYLNRLNTLACRSIHDYSQYPVFPWIVQINNNKSPQLRELDKTMGGLGTQERIQTLKEKYSAEDPFNPVPRFYYGTHYSSPGVVFNYLIRLSPFTQCCKQLQGGKFDLPDRMFFSLLSSWRSATKQMSDIRELIPEFYFLPEMFINIEGHNLGRMQNGQKVNNVQLPVWAANAYHFVMQSRQMLESQEVSKTINAWIDLIFGWRQKGKEAEASMNVFYYLTYEDAIDIDKITDEVHRTSCEAQIIHFGQTPSQLFDKPHPKREPLVKQHFELCKKGLIKLPPKEIQQQPIGLHYSESTMTLVFRNRLFIYNLKDFQVISKHNFDIQFHRGKSLYILNLKDSKTIFFNEGRLMLIGGYLDGSWRIYRIANGELITHGQANGKITSMLVTKREDMILLGTEGGVLEILEIRNEVSGGMTLKTIHKEYFESRVQHISEKQTFFSISYGQYVSIYRFTRSLDYLLQGPKPRKPPHIKFFRSFRNRSHINGSLLVESPLFSLVIYDNLGIRCYGANGQLISTINTSASVQEVTVLKDFFLHDILVYVEEDKLIALSTPDLRRISMVEIERSVVRAYGMVMLRGDGAVAVYTRG